MRSFEREEITAQELAVLGVQDVAYVKPVEAEGKPAFAICAADGTQMAVVPSRDLAFAVIRQNDMEGVSVH
ncbi:MAG TPA: DUF1150 family protein [Stellaceae bacterium]|nr:DUF1150 family protein [Stellaceae bacterium]